VETTLMTEPSGPSFAARLQGGNPIRLAIVAGVAIVLALSAAITLAASPSPQGAGSAPTTPSGSPAPRHAGPTTGFGPFGSGFGPSAGGGIRAFGFGGAGIGGPGALGGVSVTSIDGSNVALKTADGWTRTITVTSTTKITRAGKAISLADLKVGDTIAFRESKASDGAFTISAISVVLPRVLGQVTATTADTITIKQFGGTTTTVHVTGATTFQIFGVTKPTIASLKAGMTITAEGTQAANGSFDALSVTGFQFRTPQPGNHKLPANPKPGSSQGTTAPGA
jgi:hypothetical protein